MGHLRRNPSLRLVEGGRSNSRPTDKSVRAGVDTVRFRLRGDVDGYEGFSRAGEFVDGARGERRRTRDGVTVGAYPDGMQYVEARLAALVNGPDDHSLMPLAALAEGSAAARSKVTAAAAAGPVEVGRIDPASDLDFDDPDEGRAFLTAMAMVDAPWLKAQATRSAQHGVETVRLLTRGGSTAIRAYDKALESGQGEPGSRVRFERQRRYRRERAPLLGQALELDLARVFLGRELIPFVNIVDQGAYGDTRQAVDRVAALAAAGTIKRGTAEHLAGYLLLGPGPDERTNRRRRNKLRSLGIVLAAPTWEVDAVPVGSYMRQLVDAWAA
jgi:hypothetical protein